MARFIQSTEHDEFIVVTFSRGLDDVVSGGIGGAAFHEELHAVADQCKGRSLILDIENNWFNVCAAVYNIFPRLHEKLGDGLLFCNLSESATEAFAMNGLARLLNIYQTREEAIASLSER